MPTGRNMPVLQVQGFRYRYRRQAPWTLKGIDLTVEPGEYVVIAGANGSGKSTLVRACNGLIPHLYPGEMHGHVWVAGLDTRDHAIHDLIVYVGIAFQNPEAQLFTSSVEREIAFGLESLGLPSNEIRRRVEEAAAFLGIEALLPRPPHTLSGGEQQLVVLAAVLALEPRLLILDEPFAHLDAWHAQRLRQMLCQIRERGITLLVVEHHLQHVLADATRVVVLDGGHIVFDGSPRQAVEEDLSRYGIVEPPAVQWARQLGLPAVALDTAELVTYLEQWHPSAALPNLSVPSRDRRRGNAPVIQVENLCARRGARLVLEDVSFCVAEGECLAVVGPNGAGKTTLIRHLNGLLRGRSGTVRVRDVDVRSTSPARLARQVGMSFQNPMAQFFKPRVKDELEVGPRMLGCLDPKWLAGIVERFHLQSLLERSPYTLSEGEKRRLSFAIAMAPRPDVVILDEPTAGQDARSRSALLALLHTLREEGHTVILATHDLDFAEACADRWAVLAGGRLLMVAPPDEVMANADVLTQARLAPTAGFYVRQALKILRGSPKP